MSYDITFFKVIRTLKEQLQAHGLSADIRQFYWHEVPKPSLDKGVIIVGTERRAQRCDDFTVKSLGTERLEDDVAAHCIERSIERDSIQVFPLYRVDTPTLMFTTNESYNDRPIRGFAYIDNEDAKQLVADLPACEQAAEINKIVEAAAVNTVRWMYNEIYQAKLMRGSKTVWDSGFIYHVEDWAQYLTKHANI